MSDETPTEGGWVVRKDDGIELKFPSLESLKTYIISGVVGPGDVVAPEHEGWAKMEDLAQIAALVGHHHTLDPADSRPAPKTRSGLRRQAKTIPPPLPIQTTDVLDVKDLNNVVEALASEPPDDAVEQTPIEVDIVIEPEPQSPSVEPAPPARLQTGEDHSSLDIDVSRPIRGHSDEPVDTGAMIRELKRQQRTRNIVFSVVLGVLIGVVAFLFAREDDHRVASDKLSTIRSPPTAERPSNAPKPKAESASVATAVATKSKTGRKAAPQELPEGTDSTIKIVKTEDTDPSPPRSPAPTAQGDRAGVIASPPTPDTRAVLGSQDSQANTATSTANEDRIAPQKPSKKSKKMESPQRSASTPSKSNFGPDPTTIDGLLRKARKLRNDEPREALRLYKKVLAIRPSHVDAMHMAGRAMLRLGQTNDAISMLRRCRKTSPRFSPCLYFLGRALDKAGQRDAARRAYKTLVDENPESSYALKARTKLGL